MHYFGAGALPPAAKDTLIHLTPRLGWKLTIARFFMIDIFTGYKMILVDARNYSAAGDFVNAGLRFGAGIKLFLNTKREGEQI